MNRSSRPVPLAQWLTSRNPTLRTHAETALYHFGPDAGEALYQAAESVSLSRTIQKNLFSLVFHCIGQSIFFSLLIAIAHARLEVIWCGWIAGTIARHLWIICSELYWRRERLKILGLALAKRNDLRSIGPLLDAWRPLSSLRMLIPDDDIEHELTRLLPQFLAQKSIDLRSYKKRGLRRKIKRLFPRQLAGNRIVARGDFSDARADLIVTLVQLLSRSTSPQDRILVERIGQIDAVSINDILIRDVALVCEQAPLPVAPPPAPAQPAASANASPIAGPTPQIQAVAKRS